MPSINKGIFNDLLIEVFKYCSIDFIKNLDLNINEVPIYKAPEPDEPEQPKPIHKKVVLSPPPARVPEKIKKPIS